MKFDLNKNCENFHYVPKGWGGEIWIVNNDLYCGKILHFNAGKMLSWHYHKIKTETFYVQKGRIKLIYGWDEDIDKENEIILGPDSSFDIPVGLIHRVIALEESYVYEFSTKHMDEDSYRILKGD